MQQPLEPTINSDIIFHNVYATLMNQTSVYTCFYQSEPAYRSANTNLKTSQLFQFSDHNIFRIKHASVFRSSLSMIKPHDDNTFQALISHSIIHHHPHRCILSSDHVKHHKPITCILDLTLHQIFNTCTLDLMIFSSFYGFRPFSIPWTKTT